MNCKEHNLPELELATGQVREALQCILHTILFIRSPGPVTPQDTELEFFQFNYTKIANETKIEKRVDDAIESFLRSLSQIGPELLSVSWVFRSENGRNIQDFINLLFPPAFLPGMLDVEFL